MAKETGKGKIQNDNDLHAAFSKRRIVLFKLTGAHNASRYKTQIAQHSPEVEKMKERQKDVELKRLEAELELLQHQLEFEKKRGECLDKMNGEGSEKNWWEDDVENMSVDQLKALKVAMIDLQERVLNDQEELLKQEILRKPDSCEIGHAAASVTAKDSTFGDVPFDCSEAPGDFLGNEQKGRDGF